MQYEIIHLSMQSILLMSYCLHSEDFEEVDGHSLKNIDCSSVCLFSFCCERFDVDDVLLHSFPFVDLKYLAKSVNDDAEVGNP